jgi:hypothetical protein
MDLHTTDGEGEVLRRRAQDVVTQAVPAGRLVVIESVRGDYQGSTAIDVVLGEGSLAHLSAIKRAGEAQGFEVRAQREYVGSSKPAGSITQAPTIVLRHHRGLARTTSAAWQVCSFLSLLALFGLAAMTFLHLLHM